MSDRTVSDKFGVPIREGDRCAIQEYPSSQNGYVYRWTFERDILSWVLACEENRHTFHHWKWDDGLVRILNVQKIGEHGVKEVRPTDTVIPMPALPSGSESAGTLRDLQPGQVWRLPIETNDDAVIVILCRSGNEWLTAWFACGPDGTMIFCDNRLIAEKDMLESKAEYNGFLSDMQG